VLANQILISKKIHMNENTKTRFEAKLTALVSSRGCQCSI